MSVDSALIGGNIPLHALSLSLALPVPSASTKPSKSEPNMLRDYYTTKDAADLTGASHQIIRVYTSKFERFFSTEATPEKGAVRRFTPADLKLIAYIYQSTSQTIGYDAIAEALQAGALESFDWTLPEPEEEAEAASGEYSSALIPVERLQAAQALLHDAQRREEQERERADQFQQRIADLERELGEARGELAGFRSAQYRAPAWWRALFGGRSD